MSNQNDFPYPTAVEVVRELANALDLKNSHKRMDDEAYSRVTDIRKVNQLIAEVFQPLAERFGEDANRVCVEHMKQTIESYTQMVGRSCADGVCREQMLPLLMKYFFPQVLVKIITETCHLLPGLNPSELLREDRNAISAVLDWAEKNTNFWAGYYQGLTIDEKGRIRSWCRRSGNELPTSQSIASMGKKEPSVLISNNTFIGVKFFLLIGRAIEYSKRTENGQTLINYAKDLLWGISVKDELESQIRFIQIEITPSRSHLEKISRLQHQLKLTTNKSKGVAEELKEDLISLRSDVSDLPVGSTSWLDWMEGRWFMLSGETKSALELYKRAYQDCLYRSGDNQKFLMEEAQVVAAISKNPDKVFLRQLKSSMTLFGYDIASVTNKGATAKLEDTVESWEIEMWRSSFGSIFPEKGFFPGCSVDSGRAVRVGPLINSYEKKRLDTSRKNIDKKVKVGGTWKKTTRQLIHAIDNEDYTSVRTLLKKGASVNVQTDSGDTPILSSLELLNVTNLPMSSLDIRFFDLVSKLDHDKTIINTRTQKKRLLPLISAIESGIPEIVKKVLSMGADVNMRGLTDEQTPLHLCLKYIFRLKSPEQFLDIQNDHPLNDHALDSIRRYTNGAMGHTLDQVRSNVENIQKKFGGSLDEVLGSIQQEQLQQHMSIGAMILIAKSLLEAGADPNAEHVSPLKGYTPLMLAAENDEIELFKLMLLNGGNPKKTYPHPVDGRGVDCWDIAHFFRASSVYRLLKDIEPQFPKNGDV